MTFSVAITVRNDRDNTRALLDSLANQTRAPDELVVVDAFSTDGTWDAIQTFASAAPFPTRIEQHAGGRGAGRSRCVELATGDIVVFIDSDCVVPDDWLERYEKAWAQEAAREGKPLGAIGGASHTPPGSTDFQWAVDDVMSVMEEASFHGINTINCCYLKQAAHEAGLFDADLHTAEDPDINARIAKAGYRLQRVDNPVHHKRRETWGKLVRQHYEYGKGAAALLARHPEYFPVKERAVAPLMALSVLVFAALGFWHPIFWAAIPIGLIGVPLYTHRRLTLLFLRRHGLSARALRRLGVLWVVYVPYQWGVLIGRLNQEHVPK